MGLRTASVTAVMGLVGTAAADPVADLEAKGEALAKEGRYSEAIDTFKAADRLVPTAHHLCLIALAYTRRELWPQAEIFMDSCQRRATVADPVPPWFPEEAKILHDRLVSAQVAAVEIVVVPAAAVQLSVSDFAPDETFAPRTIHLAPGHHVIRATAPGFEHADVPIDITDSASHHIVIRLRQLVPPLAGTPRALILGGAIALVAGGVTYGVMGFAWSKLDGAYPTHASQYDSYHGVYIGTRYATWGLWALGAGLAITGYVIHRVGGEHAPTVAVAPISGGSMIAVGWQR
jgi:hypothetical protein